MSRMPASAIETCSDLDAASETGAYEWRAGEDRLVWSPALLRIYGLSEAPQGEGGFSALVHPQDRVRVEAETSGYLGGDAASYSHQFRILRPDGSVRFILDRGVIERDAHGRALSLRGMNIDVTEVAQPEPQPGALAESASLRIAELEALYAEAPLGLAILDRDLRFVHLNRALAEINGRNVGEHLGRTLWDLVPRLRESAEPPLRQILTTGLPLRNVRIVGETAARPGVMREWCEHFYPLRGSDGAIQGIGVICEDVTDRVASERALAESEARLAAAMRAGRLGVHDFDPRTGGIEWDARVRGTWGVTADEPITFDTFIAGLHPDDVAATKAAVDAALDPDGPGHYEALYRVVHRQTRDVRWVRAAGDVTFDGRAALRLVGTVQDVTDQKEAEQRLRGAHDRFRQLVDHSPFGIYAIDADFRLAQVSQGAQKVFENVRPLIGRDLAEVLRILWPEPFASEAIGRFRRTLETGEPYHAPSTVERRADIAATEAYDWKLERIMMPDGRDGVVCHFYDLSERQAYEENIRYLMRESNHRVKNMLSLVDAVARQTAAAGAEDFLPRFSDRLRALAASQDLLVQTEWKGADLAALIESQLLHFADLIGRRILLDGAPFDLSAAAARTLGMALHELATNAAKYGALSNGRGRVEIAWRVGVGDGDETFSISWTERNGPRVKAPVRDGFGGRVVKSMVEQAFSGAVTLEYAESGVVWTLRCPLASISGPKHKSA
jgi:PAS domain S-box-containing protein